MHKIRFIVFLTIITLFCLIFFSFFMQGLPRFWHDDIFYYENINETPYSEILLRIVDIFHKTPFVRETNYLIAKLNTDLFGENLFLYRITKMLVVSLSVCIGSFFLFRDHKKPFIILASFLLFITSPVTLIEASWITTTGQWTLLAKLISFMLFSFLYQRSKTDIVYMLFVYLMIAVAFFAIGAREDFIISPAVMFAFLLLKRSRDFRLYAVVAVITLIVFPYYLFWDKGDNVTFRLANVGLFMVLFKQILILLPFVGLAVYMHLTKKRLVLSDAAFLSLIWVTFEAVFVFFYPSSEMRYLTSLFFAVLLLFVPLLQETFLAYSVHRSARIVLVFTLLLGFQLFTNTSWAYSFRGSFGSSMLSIDKMMTHINKKYSNSLCLYEHFTLQFYAWKTSNHYVNIFQNCSGCAQMNFEEYFTRRKDDAGKSYITVKHPDTYTHIIYLNKLAIKYNKSTSQHNALFITEGINKTLYDKIQQTFMLPIYSTSLY